MIRALANPHTFSDKQKKKRYPHQEAKHHHSIARTIAHIAIFTLS